MIDFLKDIIKDVNIPKNLTFTIISKIVELEKLISDFEKEEKMEKKWLCKCVVCNEYYWEEYPPREDEKQKLICNKCQNKDII
jgi:hypothetical protein